MEIAIIVPAKSIYEWVLELFGFSSCGISFSLCHSSSSSVICLNIASNSTAIGLNSAGILSNTNLIGANSSAIGLNTEAIGSLRDGSAALASIPDLYPDLYLQTDETWSVSGGLALYDDGFGGTETGFGGGIQIRNSTEAPWSGGLTGAVSGDAAVVRLQGRIGG